MTLNELRLWHWDRVTSHRCSETKYRERIASGDMAKFYNERKLADHQREASFHIKCVQALNNVLETTVFQDLKRKGE